jgi:hypothetical protein
MRQGFPDSRLGRACAMLALSVAGLAIQRLGTRSGVTDTEADGQLPGDDIVNEPMWQSTRATTINAPPERIWPWIVQMGYPAFRAGWYTPYWLDRLQWGIRERSSDRIIEELQTLSVGDRVPDSPDWSVYFTVAKVEADHALVLRSTLHILPPMRSIEFSWAFVLQPIDTTSTRFLVRARARYAPRRSWLVLWAPYSLGDFLNTTNILHAVKRRSERPSAPATSPTAHRVRGWGRA